MNLGSKLSEMIQRNVMGNTGSLQPPIVHDEDFSQLKAIVKSNKLIPRVYTCLDLREIMGEQKITEICKWLSDHRCPFRTVKFQKLRKSQVVRILNTLRNNKKTRVSALSLMKCNVGDKEAEVLAELIKSNTSLNELNLNYNLIDGFGLESLNLAIKENFFIHTVHIMNNPCQELSSVGRSGKLVGLDTYQYAKRNRDNNEFSSLYGSCLQAGKTARWGRSKLMVIGQGGAGKTSTVRSLLNLPFNDKWDSTIGASLTKTSTTNWQEGNVNESDFNHMAAQVYKEARDLMVLDAKRKEMEAEAIRLRNEKALAKYQTKEYQEKVKRERKALTAVNFLEPRTRDVSSIFSFWRGKKKTSNPAVEAELVELDLQQRNDEASYAVDALPEDPGNFEAADPSKPLMDGNEVARRYGQKMISKAVEFDSEVSDDSVTFSIWDYGGQKVFYTLHHLFLTKYGVYLLAFDICELITVKGSGEKQVMEVNPEAIEYLEFWVNSVVLHAPDAPLIIAGTHIDKIPKDVTRTEFFKEAHVALKDIVKVYKHQNLIDNDEENLCFFPLDNKERGKSVVNLRESIEDSVVGKFYVEQKIPLRWVFLCDALIDDEEYKNDAWHDLSKVIDLGAKFDIPPNEIVQMLKLFNQLGVMVYLDATNGLQNRVVTDPQWLINNLGLVIRDDMHGMPARVPAEMEHHWEFARETGIVSQALLHALWVDQKIDEQQNMMTIRFLVDLMTNSMLLSVWDYSILECFQEKLKMTDKYYLVPSLIPEETTLSADFVREVREKSTCEVLLDFSSFFLPTGVFQRFICLLLLMFRSISNAKGNHASKKKKIVATDGNVGQSNVPLLGPDFARFAFESVNVFETVLYMSAFEKDCIQLSIANELYAPKLILAVNAIIKKIKSEVMGGKLDIQVMVSSLKKVVVSQTPAAKVEQEEKACERQTEPDEIKFLNLQEAKTEDEYKFWFERTENHTNAIAKDIDFEALFA